MNKILQTVVASITLVGIQPAAFALALSEITLNSSLNQTLDATVEISAATTQELDSLNIAVARLETRPGSYQWPGVKVELIRVENGKSYLKLTSREAVREPVLNFLLELDWTTGRIKREYSLLINPRF